MVQRLGQPEIVEPCEELRLYIIEMLCSVSEICQEKVGVYIDDMIKILQRTLVDTFHDVRKVSVVLLGTPDNILFACRFLYGIGKDCLV